LMMITTLRSGACDETRKHTQLTLSARLLLR
jgi:hypothetical protein